MTADGAEELTVFHLFIHLALCEGSADFISAGLSQIYTNTSSWSVYTSLSLKTRRFTRLGYRSIESACPSRLDLIILLSGCSLTHIIILEREAYRNYSAIYHSLLHSPYTLNDRLPLHPDASYWEYRISVGKLCKVLTAGKIKTLAIETPITVHAQHALQRYADGETETRRRERVPEPRKLTFGL